MTSPDSRSASKLSVRCFRDQNSDRWIRVALAGKSAFAAVEQFIDNQRDLFIMLSRKGIDLPPGPRRADFRKLVQSALSEIRPAVAVDRCGWTDDLPGNYAMPGRALPAKVKNARVIDRRPEHTSGWSKCGTWEGWEAGVRRFGRGQSRVVFSLSLGFAALIQKFVPNVAENVGFELYGGSSIGKTTLLNLVATIYGRPIDYRRGWDTTINALEDTFLERGDQPLLLDEQNQFLGGALYEPKIEQAIHKLAAGTVKDRYQQTHQSPHRLVFLSTANQRADAHLGVLTPSRIEALQVRMPSVPADAGKGYGVVDQLPDGCHDSRAAIAELGIFVDENYGFAGPRFIRQLEHRLATHRGRVTLTKSIRRRMEKFRRRAKKLHIVQDGIGERVLDKFALVYAAGGLARKFGILPVPRIRMLILRVYRDYLAGLPATSPAHATKTSAIDRVCQYAALNAKVIVDLTSKKASYPDLDATALDAVPGFRRIEPAGECLLMRRARWNSEFGADANEMLRELDRMGLLVTTEGKEVQRKVRRSSPKDRLVCVTIAQAR